MFQQICALTGSLILVLVGACYAAEKPKANRHAAIHLVLHDPMVVAQDTTGIRKWGPYQFPAIQRLPDGKLAVTYHVEADSAKAYGRLPGLALSDDNGQTWRMVPPGDKTAWARSRIFALPNGDFLRQVTLPPVDPRTVENKLPRPLATIPAPYGARRTRTLFDASKFPDELAGYRFSRRSAGTDKWVEETATVNIPGELRTISENVLVRPWFWRIAQAPDGSLWGINHERRRVDGKVPKHSAALFLRSTDGGRTWNFLSEIPYEPDLSADPVATKRDGFTEPNVAFLPDRSVFCLLRTTDGKGVGPLYVARSTDGGKSWTKPVVFDNCGVWPALLTLNNGVTLTSYGRPGLYIRATADPSAKHWTERTTIVQPKPRQKDTCSYSDLIALSDNEALIVYSDFNFPDRDGKPHKTILVQRITIR